MNENQKQKNFNLKVFAKNWQVGKKLYNWKCEKKYIGHDVTSWKRWIDGLSHVFDVKPCLWFANSPSNSELLLYSWIKNVKYFLNTITFIFTLFTFDSIFQYFPFFKQSLKIYLTFLVSKHMIYFIFILYFDSFTLFKLYLSFSFTLIFFILHLFQFNWSL